MLLIFLPTALAFIAVTVVSVYAVKVQIKLAMKIHPKVNLPNAMDDPLPSRIHYEIHSGETPKKNTIWENNFQRKIKRNEFDNIDIIEEHPKQLEDERSVHELDNTESSNVFPPEQPKGKTASSDEDLDEIQIICLAFEKHDSAQQPKVKINNYVDDSITDSEEKKNENIFHKEEKKSNLEIRRINSDPNSFFRVPTLLKDFSTSTKGSSCFKSLTLIVERIMMLNVAALILILMFIMEVSFRKGLLSYIFILFNI